MPSSKTSRAQEGSATNSEADANDSKTKASLKSSVSSLNLTDSSLNPIASSLNSTDSQFSNSSDDSALDAAERPSLKSGPTGSKITYNGTTYIGEQKNTMVKNLENYTLVQNTMVKNLENNTEKENENFEKDQWKEDKNKSKQRCVRCEIAGPRRCPRPWV